MAKPKLNNALRDRILKNSTIEETAILSESKFFNEKDVIRTKVPMINVALSGRVDGGMTPGITMIAGPSKHFKTGFGLLAVSAFLEKYPDGIILFYDTEFGSPTSYFESYGIPTDHVVHTPIVNIEVLKHDIMNQMAGITREDHIMIIIDSIGNIASKKEIEDALEGKSVADMTRAKALKSLFRMVTPHLTIKDIPMIVINHTYKTQEMYSKDVVSGGTGPTYNADNIWIIGRQQDKDGKELQGFNFTINVEKSRFVKEKSKINIMISFNEGIKRYSGLFDLALEAGIITNPKQGRYTFNGAPEDVKPVAREQIEQDNSVWEAMLKEKGFTDFIESKYRLSQIQMLNTDDDPGMEDDAV